MKHKSEQSFGINTLLGKRTLAFVLAGFLVAISGTAWTRGPGGGGGPNKIEVTAADPAEAEQGQELDVFVTGSGFDEGSTATWFVTGTSDDTQVQVLENEYLPATGQLRARVRVNANATLSEYDIEVRASSGRRGKGTTLFRVQQGAATACADENKEPEIAYLRSPELRDGVNSWDIVLASETGCYETVLVYDAQLELPDTQENEGLELRISDVSGLKFAARDGRGIVAWYDSSAPDPLSDPWTLWAFEFDFDAEGNIYPRNPNASEVYSAPNGRSVIDLDVRLNAEFEPEFILTEALVGGDVRDAAVTTLNSVTGAYELVWTGECLLVYEGTCFRPDWCCVVWGEDENQVFVTAYPTETSYNKLITSVSRVNDQWGEPSLIVRPQAPGFELGLLSALEGRVLLYWTAVEETNRGGKVVGRGVQWFFVDVLNECSASPCIAGDGFPLVGDLHGGTWTADGRIVFYEGNMSGNATIRELQDPVAGTEGPLQIREVAYQLDVAK